MSDNLYYGDYWIDSKFDDSTLLTNFSHSEKIIYETAIAEYERITGEKDRYYIENSAFNIYGEPITALSLHTKYRSDSSHFWRIYKEIQNNITMFNKPKKFNKWKNKNLERNIWD